MKLKEGFIVKTVKGRYWIVLNVTKKRWKEGVNCDSPGLHLFTGYWYNKHVDKYSRDNEHFRKIGCYGKINPCNQPLKVVGYTRNSFLIRRKMR